ncbi:MAG: RnfABCDGE type electron transport complex subunit D [Candidatus Glassbacteria bacterium]|nr:RnfABCDGE type electron transport complex subunit D [Candidatus Glassbacteria bacterium]
MAEINLKVSSSPHIYTAESIPRIMVAVVLSLVPAAAGAVYFFGLHAAMLIALAAGSAVGVEALCQKVRGVPVKINDFSAAVTGVLLAFNLPANVPWWMAIVGSAFAIVVVKELFGGLGYNIWNPALAARAFLLASWPTSMISSTDFPAPRDGTLSGLQLDSISQSTPLQFIKNVISPLLDKPEEATRAQLEAVRGALEQMQGLDYVLSLFWGRVGGVIGETSVALLLIGAIYLLIRGYIDWRVPLGYIGSVAVLAWVFAGPEGYFTGNAAVHVFSGGLILGAFFMATDMVTTPVTRKGKWIFALGCGVLTMLIRIKGGYPEGVSYAILLMNTATPLIDSYTRPKIYGGS